MKDPIRYTEKLQWYKINYCNPKMHQCVDKYYVREYVAEISLDYILVPLIGHYDSLNDICWNELPNKFVIKTTHGSGGLNVLVCTDKSQMDKKDLEKKLKIDTGKVKENTLGRDWAYYGLTPGIIIEELLDNSERQKVGINDYNIFCYNGKAKYFIVDVDRYIGHKRNFYDRNWKNLHITSDCPASDRDIPKPSDLDEILRIAEKLSKGFSYVRVDLYDVDKKIYFGELTFYPWNGYVRFYPDEWDYRFGEDFNLVKWESTLIAIRIYHNYTSILAEVA